MKGRDLKATNGTEQEAERSTFLDLQERFDMLMSLGNEGIFILKEDHGIEFANQKAHEISGHRKGELIGKNFLSLFDEETGATLRDLFRGNRYMSPKRYSSETKLLLQGDEKIDVELTLSSSRDRSGRSKAYCFIRDISHRKKIARELLHANIRLKRVSEMGDNGILVFDANRFIRFANPMAAQLTGYSVEALLGMDFARLLDEQGRAFLKEVLPQVQEDTSKRLCTQLSILTADGERKETEVCLALGELSEGRFKTYAYIRDLSERLRIENELRKANEFTVNVIKSSVDGIIAADMKGNIIIFNEGAERLLKYRAEDVIGKIHITRLYPPGRAKEIMKKLRSDQHGPRGKLETTHTLLIDKEGEEIPVNISAAIVYEGMNETASVGIFTDLRERIRMQEKLEQTHLQLVQSEKLASLGKLAAGVAHEINNPLGGILMYATMMLEDMPPDDPRAEDLKQIIEQSLRSKEIVKGLLEFARQTGKEKGVVDLNHSLDQAMALFENQAIFHNIDIIREFDQQLPQITGDSSQLNQVFINLITNAADAIPSKGTLRIQTRYHPEKEIVGISFEDNGCGIPEKNLSKIFDPFFTTKDVGKGTGLGLSMSYGIIERHGGKIAVESQINKGTVFTIELPIEQPTSELPHARDK
jgi:PAS domain S-box-containing protein